MARRTGPNSNPGREQYARRRTKETCAVLMAIASALALLHASTAGAQERNRLQRPLASPPTQFIPCAQPGQPLIRIPELVSNEQDHILRGTVLLTDTAERVDLGIGSGNCVPQFMRNFQAVNGVLPGYAGTIPPGYPGAVPAPPATQYIDPVPGPTLRARVGDMVQLTFLNHINTGDYGDSIDRGERGQGCDESAAPYPGLDVFPDCFHGSSTGNIHFHGTHTSPSTTGDDVFIEVRPSLRGAGGSFAVTEASVHDAFDKFFAECTLRLKRSVLAQWPKSWSDFPPELVVQQLHLLAQYDADPAIRDKLLPVDLTQLAEGAWPQYYIGAFPYCFRLPEYKEKTWPPAESAHPAAYGLMMRHAEPPLIMGQAPGTHWYHAHKHGSTTIDVDNGMTGAFIIEGGYDDALNGFYGDGWTRRQPVLVLNQLGVSPNLAGGGTGPLPFSVNGRPQPTVQMQSGEVQLWRIVNTSSRSGAFFVGAPDGFQWRQIAQDGVQFNGGNYWNTLNKPFLMAPGNRVDLLVKAPLNTTQLPQSYAVQVTQAVNKAQQKGTPSTLLTVVVPSGAPVTDNRSLFIPAANMDTVFPPFLTDIKAADVKGTKTIVFETADPNPPFPGGRPPFRVHTIDGKKFDGNVGEVVLLNTVEEWKIENRTVQPAIDHPFHIHINPFQVVEVFDPNETVPGTSANKYIFEGTAGAGQCLLDINNPESWRPCGNASQSNRIWWDVFPIPSGRQVTVGTGASAKTAIVPGYFKMRSRFVDYAGQYVMHCHILAHEDRGMMNVVEVVPFTTAYSHQ
jgi:FtsP/CotA-like multicopper oxidase with cupredoxin domain